MRNIVVLFGDIQFFDNKIHIYSVDDVGCYPEDKAEEIAELSLSKYSGYVMPSEHIGHMVFHKETGLMKNIEFIKKNKLMALVWEWKNCPLEEKWIAGHGGDEDYVIICKERDKYPVVDKLTICDYNKYKIPDTDYCLYVAAHA